ncbi:MAG: DUF4091 domain-containing protein [Lentisphaeria bacterium]|nr:DUF4091 domain-containing protein [Lentisphaeria bacterium]
MKNEVFSFQAAFCCSEQWLDVEVKTDSPLAGYITVREVSLVPVEHLPEELDDDALLRTPGLAPDLLRPLWNNKIMTDAGVWQSLWFTVKIPADFPAGKAPVRITFTGCDQQQKRRFKVTSVFNLKVIDAVLPEQKLSVSHWFHGDCLATFYREKVFSEKHWQICENFIRNAVAHGMDTLLTPVFTPPLDTQVGGERPTIQLVGIKKDGQKYSFDFSRLKRWVEMAESCGIRFFEMAHLFTQWGAGFTPKIMAETAEGEKRIFGWDIPADSPEYENFLAQFLPELCAFLDRLNLRERVIFHCSDEPRKHHLKSYAYASGLIRKYLHGFKIVDAMSRMELFESGCVDIPAVCEHHYEPFRKIDLKERFIYYCCEPFSRYPNRFIHMPSCRNRIFGTLMYCYNIDGFMHWGFNFYYSRFSRFPVDPFGGTTAGHAFPAGDAFLVYPGDNGEVLDSIRHEVFYEALQDMRLLQLLETYYSRSELLRALNRFAAGKELDLLDYPKTENMVLKLRKKLESMLRKALKK